MYKQDESKFIELFSKLTGVSKATLKNYLKEYSINSIFEHPASLTTNESQLNKIKSINEMNNLYNNLSQHKDIYKITSPQDIGSYFQNRFNNIMDREYLSVAFLDTKNQVIEAKIIFTGTLSASLVHPRDIMKEALMLDSNSIIISHNHPSGNPHPSVEDRGITARLVEAGSALGIKVLDHIITGRNSYYSFKEHNESALVSEFETSYGSLAKERTSLSDKIDRAKEKSKEVNKDKKPQVKIELERN
ncbi:JAB domain-containing protein [Tissierella pigra]|uniref:DNA repair protein RadC n=1 Tax=Tissierella pigra TaxID=2607614 RepID=A0A6N7XMW1_9FIRM|nr:DNA repair protein RadC [Tissierella pigra]MSU02142.1 DNA repair protein RadC [Tissierella pigra]